MSLNNPSDNSRNNLRNFIKKTRNSLLKDQISAASNNISDCFIKWLDAFLEKNKSNIKNPIKIGAYLSTGGEVNLEPIFNYLSKKNYTHDICLYVPALHPVLKGCLQFREYDLNLDNIKIPNAYGIFEPVLDSNKTIPTWELDIVLMPLVACDENGSRLGMGGGYYDRSFAFLSNYYDRDKYNDDSCLQNSGPILIGVGYDFQKVQGLNSQDWDVGLDALISPSGGFMFF